ncbi:MAG: phosphoglycerate kinase [Myxococcales bacterium]|nr:phosphoglycerate kinase [Myxococcales bacterium]
MIRTIKNVALTGRRVFIRVDFDLPPGPGQRPFDEARIDEALPTIRYALEQKARVILATHQGNPRAKWTAARTLEPVAQRLVERLGREAKFADDCIGDGVRKLVQDMRDGELLILENLAINPGEIQNERAFAERLSELCDVLVNEAFGQANRALASTTTLPTLVQDACAGLYFLKEANRLDAAKVKLLPACEALSA